MTLNINTISDKPQFKNYFPDPLTFPKNANIALPKANLQIPVLVQPQLSAPNMGAGNYNSNAFFAQVDGVGVSITYQELYDAHKFLGGVAAPGSPNNYSSEDLTNSNIDNYYANYKFLPNNGVVYSARNEGDLTVTNKMKIPLSMIMCRALNNKYEFYDFSSDDKYSGQGYALDNQLVDQTSVLGIQTTGANDQIIGICVTASGQSLRELSFNVVYDPQKMGNSDPNENMNFLLSAFNDNWGDGTNGSVPADDDGILVLNDETTYAMASCNRDSTQFSIDPNGGWIRFTPQNNIGASNSTMACGLILVGTPNNSNYSAAFEAVGTDITQPSGPGISAIELIDVGFQFSQDDASANGGQALTYCIIDRSSSNPTEPATPSYITYEQGKQFFIHIKRGNLLNGTNQFIFSMFVGNGALNPPDSDDNHVYTCTHNFSGGDIEPGMIFMANPVAAPNNVNVGFNDVQFVPKSEQSREQGSYFESSPINEGGSMVNSISITPDISGALRNTGAYEFWYQYGLSDVANALAFNSGNQQIFGKDINNLVRSWSVKTNFSEQDMVYYLGNTNLNQLYSFTDDGFFIANPNTIFQLESLPQQLQVSLSNLDVKNFAGNFIAGGVNASGAGGILQNSSTNRVIGTVPVPLELVTQDSTVLNIQYEPYNLIYRPINNPIPFTLNELDVDIFYRDFRTGQRRTIPSVLGTIELDIHVKTGAPPAKIIDGLRPF